MFIVFDSNVWIKEFGLQSKNGAAVRHFVRLHNATVAIPEVVELEVRHVLTSELLSLRKQIVTAHRKLLPVLGKLQPLYLPSEEDIREAVEHRVLGIDVPARRLPLNVEAARSSMMKIVGRVPPSKGSEQFCDGVIWAHCLELSAEGDVYLVSADTAFFEQRKYDKGLAHELEDEINERAGTREVKLVRDLTDLLKEIRIPIDLSVRDVFDAIRVLQGETIDELLGEHGFQLAGDPVGHVTCFATEKAEETYFRFDVSHRCKDATERGRRAGTLKLKGFGFLDIVSKEASEVNLSNMLLDYPDWNPEKILRRGIHFLHMDPINAPEFHRVRAERRNVEFPPIPTGGDGTESSDT